MSQRVSIAECLIAQAPSTLRAYGLGSCLAVSLYDPQQKIGALGHMLLPKWSEKHPADAQDKFVDAGIRRMVDDLVAAGTEPQRLVAKIAGGANMFGAEYQILVSNIGARNAMIARQTLALLGIPLLGEDIGGNRGRSVKFDLASGTLFVYCARDTDQKAL